MGLQADYAALGADQTQQAVLNGNVTAALAAQAAGNTTITTQSQQVVTDLSDTTVYPTGGALLPDPTPLPGGSYLLITLTNGNPPAPPGFAVQQFPLAQ